jgi:hypothetical protein
MENKEKMPIPEQFGWNELRGAWMITGGEYAYIRALKYWEELQSKEDN